MKVGNITPVIYSALIGLLLLRTQPAFSQFELKGRVVAADSKTPLALASVFLSNTSVGTTTNAAGEFTLFIPAGKFDLIASFVGYETRAQTVSERIPQVLVIELKPKAEVFDEVVVGGYEKDGWQKWGQFFLENFIGTSEWAADCKIKNQEVIKFRNLSKEHKLLGIALDQLVIENKGLGYTVKYQLEDFEYDFNTHFLLYVGYPLFTPMEGNEAKQKRWKKRREDVYYGSMMEFMRAVYRNRVKEEGYDVRRMVKHRNEEKLRLKELYRRKVQAGRGQPILLSDSNAYYENVLQQPDEYATFSPYTMPGDSIAFALDSVTAGLQFPDYLHITYTRAAPPDSYSRLSSDNKQMISQINLIAPEPIQIQSGGNYYPPANLISSGYWGWAEKIANMLPFDYKPPPRRN